MLTYNEYIFRSAKEGYDELEPGRFNYRGYSIDSGTVLCCEKQKT